MNYYPFHIGDYVSHTSHLSDAEDLAYRRMIDLYYQSEQPFTDINLIARRVRSTPEIISVLLSDFFVKSEDGWRNKRADEEIAKYKAKAESARNANKSKIRKKSEMKPTLKSELKSEPNQDATNNQEPITNNHNKYIASKEEKIVFNEKDFVFENITSNQKEVWKKAFPAVNLDVEMAKAVSWLIANPTKKKSNYTRFLNGWFTRCQDSGGTKQSKIVEEYNPFKGAI